MPRTAAELDEIQRAICAAGHYAPGGQHGIVRVPGSPWLVVDSWYTPGTDDLCGVGVFLSGTMPGAPLLTPDDFAPLADAAALARDWNFQFSEPARLALRRATNTGPWSEIVENKANRAFAYMLLAGKIRAAPDVNHRVTIGGWTVGYVT